MKKLISVILVVLVMGVLSACGFDSEAAKQNSEKQIKELVTVYNDQEVIAPMDQEQLKESVHETFGDFFTDSFLESVDKEIEGMEKDINKVNFKSPTVFFMEDNSRDEEVKFVKYKLTGEEITVNEDSETVIANLVATGVAQNMFVEITMKQENDQWKIDEVKKK